MLSRFWTLSDRSTLSTIAAVASSPLAPQTPMSPTPIITRALGRISSFSGEPAGGRVGFSSPEHPIARPTAITIQNGDLAVLHHSRLSIGGNGHPSEIGVPLRHR